MLVAGAARSARACLAASSPAPSSAMRSRIPSRPTSPRRDRATWSIRPMRRRCPDRDAIGRACPSTTCTATWSAGAVAQWQSASKPRRTIRRFEIKNPAGSAPAGFRLPRSLQWRREFAALLFELSVFRRSLLHIVEHRRGWPAIDLEPVRLLIGAERRAREHAGLAVDLVLVEAELGQRTLHRLDLRGAQLRVFAPWRLERTRIGDALAQMADEQHVEIGEIVFLDDVIVLKREERRPVGAFRQQQRRRLVEFRRGGFTAIGECKSLFEPIAERTRDLGDADGAVHALRRVHFIGPARAALPALADELLRGGGERIGH